jgi:hypothetical protein
MPASLTTSLALVSFEVRLSLSRLYPSRGASDGASVLTIVVVVADCACAKQPTAARPAARILFMNVPVGVE